MAIQAMSIRRTSNNTFRRIQPLSPDPGQTIETITDREDRSSADNFGNSENLHGIYDTIRSNNACQNLLLSDCDAKTRSMY